MCFFLCRFALGQDRYLEAYWGHLVVIFGPLWADVGDARWPEPCRSHSGTFQEPQKTALKTFSSTTANGNQALPWQITSTASAVLMTALSVPLPAGSHDNSLKPRKSIGKMKVFVHVDVL